MPVGGVKEFRERCTFTERADPNVHTRRWVTSAEIEKRETEGVVVEQALIDLSRERQREREVEKEREREEWKKAQRQAASSSQPTPPLLTSSPPLSLSPLCFSVCLPADADWS